MTVTLDRSRSNRWFLHAPLCYRIMVPVDTCTQADLCITTLDATACRALLSRDKGLTSPGESDCFFVQANQLK